MNDDEFSRPPKKSRPLIIIWLPLAFAPAGLELMFKWNAGVFLIVALSGSILAGGGLFPNDRLSALLVAAAFFFLNLVVGVVIGCSAAS